MKKFLSLLLMQVMIQDTRARQMANHVILKLDGEELSGTMPPS